MVDPLELLGFVAKGLPVAGGIIGVHLLHEILKGDAHLLGDRSREAVEPLVGEVDLLLEHGHIAADDIRGLVMQDDGVRVAVGALGERADDGGHRGGEALDDDVHGGLGGGHGLLDLVAGGDRTARGVVDHDEDRELGRLVVIERDARADVIGELLGHGAVERDAAIADVQHAIDERVLEILRLGLAGDLAGFVFLLEALDLVGEAGDGVGGLELELLGFGFELADLIGAFGQASAGTGGFEASLALELGALVFEGGGFGGSLGEAERTLGGKFSNLGLEWGEFFGALGIGEGELGVDSGLLDTHAVGFLHGGLLLGRELVALGRGDLRGEGGRCGDGGRGGCVGSRSGGLGLGLGLLGEHGRNREDGEREDAEGGAEMHEGVLVLN